MFREAFANSSPKGGASSPKKSGIIPGNVKSSTSAKRIPGNVSSSKAPTSRKISNSRIPGNV